MDREQFYGKLAGLDEVGLKKALWNLYWRGSAAVRERIEAELNPPADRPKRGTKAHVEPGLVLAEVRSFVELARSGAYLGGDRRVSPQERPRWRYTFQRLAGDARAALHAEEVGDACEAMELLIDLACGMKDHEYFRSEDPVAAARFVVSDAVALLWHTLREEYGFAGFAQRAAAQLVRWESPYGWTRHGDGSVGDREVPLAEVLAGMLPDPDAWVGFADAYLDVLDGYSTILRWVVRSMPLTRPVSASSTRLATTVVSPSTRTAWDTSRINTIQVGSSITPGSLPAQPQSGARHGAPPGLVIPGHEPARGRMAATSENAAAFPCCQNQQTHRNAMTRTNARSKCAPRVEPEHFCDNKLPYGR